MAQSYGLAAYGMASVFDAVQPDILLLQGDRGEMLAGAVVGAHMNIPVVHMSGGDKSGSIDDSIRMAISSFAHIHLTTCEASSRRLLKRGEGPDRIFQVGDPGLDRIKNMPFIPGPDLADEFHLDLAQPIIMAAQHPVTTEAASAAWQIRQTLEALAELNIQTVFTYPNSDCGGREMVRVLEEFRGHSFLRIVPNLGSRKFLSLLKIAALMVGNSSSGIFEAPSFKLPAVNIGTRQSGRLRANNVIDTGYRKEEIVNAVTYGLHDPSFQARLSSCVNPYGDGNAAEKTVDILKRLTISTALLTKWLKNQAHFLAEQGNGV